ncbi:hypothetical protein ACSSS7_007468 [Eimeria intestinalis]
MTVLPRPLLLLLGQQQLSSRCLCCCYAVLAAAPAAASEAGTTARNSRAAVPIAAAARAETATATATATAAAKAAAAAAAASAAAARSAGAARRERQMCPTAAGPTRAPLLSPGLIISASSLDFMKNRPRQQQRHCSSSSSSSRAAVVMSDFAAAAAAAEEEKATLDMFCVCAPGLESLLAREMQMLLLSPEPHLAAASAAAAAGDTAAATAAAAAAEAAAAASSMLSVDVQPGGVALKGPTELLWNLSLRSRIAEEVRVAVGQPFTSSAESPMSCRAACGREEVSVAASGPLTPRLWRVRQGLSPLRETLAAAAVFLSPVLALLHQHKTLTVMDPMCGSGTLLLELLSLAAGLPPNSPRRSLPFVRFPGHQRARFEAFLDCLRILSGNSSRDSSRDSSSRSTAAAAAAAKTAAAANTAAATCFAVFVSIWSQAARLNVEAFRLRAPRLAQKGGTELDEGKAGATAASAAARTATAAAVPTAARPAAAAAAPAAGAASSNRKQRSALSFHSKTFGLLGGEAPQDSMGPHKPERVLNAQREPCVLLTNLPYGVRSGASSTRRHLIQRLETALNDNPNIETACVIAQSALPWRSLQRFNNSGIDVHLFEFSRRHGLT